MVTVPPSIKALDPDTDPTNITYNMEGNTSITYYINAIYITIFKMSALYHVFVFCNLVYPEKYRDNVRFENGTFVLLQSFANFSGYEEESDFTVTVTMQVKYSKALCVFVWQWLSRLSVVGLCVGLGFQSCSFIVLPSDA